MSRITLRQMRYLVALARHGHFGRAAEACAISQPALSLQIKELELALGVPLVERGGRQVRLTSIADVFVERAEAVLRQVDEMEDLARATVRPLAGRLRIGLIPTIAPYLLPSLMHALSAQFPGLEVTPRESVTGKLIEEVLEGRLDTALLALPVNVPSLHEHAIFEEDFVLVRPLDDAGRPVPDSEALRRMRLLLLEEGHCFRDQALAFCRMESTVKGIMEASSLTTLVQMVSAGIGVTLIPQMAVAIETSLAAVSIARFTGTIPTRTVGMVWRRTNPLSDQLQHVARLVETLIKA